MLSGHTMGANHNGIKVKIHPNEISAMGEGSVYPKKPA
jgi:hypothetical protein